MDNQLSRHEFEKQVAWQVTIPSDQLREKIHGIRGNIRVDLTNGFIDQVKRYGHENTFVVIIGRCYVYVDPDNSGRSMTVARAVRVMPEQESDDQKLMLITTDYKKDIKKTMNRNIRDYLNTHQIDEFTQVKAPELRSLLERYGDTKKSEQAIANVLDGTASWAFEDLPFLVNVLHIPIEEILKGTEDRNQSHSVAIKHSKGLDKAIDKLVSYCNSINPETDDLDKVIEVLGVLTDILQLKGAHEVADVMTPLGVITKHDSKWRGLADVLNRIKTSKSVRSTDLDKYWGAIEAMYNVK